MYAGVTPADYVLGTGLEEKSFLAPEDIKRHVNRKVASGAFYRYAFRPEKGNANCAKLFEKLTVGDCKTLTDHHVGRVLDLWPRWVATHSKSTAKTIADHVFWANRYWVRYHELAGIELDPTTDLPFPAIPVDRN